MGRFRRESRVLRPETAGRVGAARLPGVRSDREAYLRTALARHCAEDELRRAIEETPAAAGILLAVLDRVANESIRYETAKVSTVSAAAGIPGFIALPATVPADVAQYFAHMLRIAQKLAGYLGVEMTKQTFVKSVSKAIPLVGAAVSGGLTFATFRPMSRRLKTHLSGLELAKPARQVITGKSFRTRTPRPQTRRRSRSRAVEGVS
ncbi:hypothetical protein OG413_36800 [Streptomyces sp. NBC_01433]|uniref:hypothetical protein n=1 Tax=Streptomyces sp. NBC_01433 TaxID=2903864 RepID=UPI002255791A|nr:hypothetical protein [Streptomyces sp. NBC_01433]MCX4680775.1 hypothetical protein [Streptomyces sp. NBC_01433]